MGFNSGFKGLKYARNTMWFWISLCYYTGLHLFCHLPLFPSKWSCTSAPPMCLLGLQRDNLILFFTFTVVFSFCTCFDLQPAFVTTHLVDVVYRNVKRLYRDQSWPRSALWMTPYGTVRLGHTVASRWLCPHTLQLSRQVATLRMEWLQELHILR